MFVLKVMCTKNGSTNVIAHLAKAVQCTFHYFGIFFFGDFAKPKTTIFVYLECAHFIMRFILKSTNKSKVGNFFSLSFFMFVCGRNHYKYAYQRIVVSTIA